LLRSELKFCIPRATVEVIRLATARDVVFYTLDSRGLYTSVGGGYDASGEYQMTRIMVLLPEI
jgi:hypothetical protein